MYYHDPHFADEESEARGRYVICLGSHSQYDLDSHSVAPELVLLTTVHITSFMVFLHASQYKSSIILSLSVTYEVHLI